MKVEKSKENLKMCICMKCPSYSLKCKVKSMPGNILHYVEGLEKQEHFESLFCAFDKSDCITENNGCVCPECKVAEKNDLKNIGFCFHGAAL